MSLGIRRAVNVMQWIGERIELVDQIEATGDPA